MTNTVFNRQAASKIYKKFLTSLWPTCDDKMKPPMGSKLFEQMCALTDKFIEQPSTIQKALDNNQKVLWWSDQHFFHKNIIQFSNRPFEDFDMMNDKLIKNYFNTVSDSDVVVWAGDCAFGSSQRAKDFLHNKHLPGYKILILGNHDFDKNDKTWRQLDIFDEILLCDGISIEWEGKKTNFIITHYPVAQSLLPENTFNIHGHIHEKNFGLPYINVSVEVLDYQPKTLRECFSIAQNIKNPTLKI